MARFNSGDELASMLGKALQIELSFEQEAQWEGYFEKDALRKVLMELILDSGRHADTVRGLIDRARVSSGHVPAPAHGRPFNFRNKNDLEMMMEMGRTERLMRDLYSDIRETVAASGPEVLKDGTDRDAFLADLDTLIEAEKRHSDLVSSYVGKVERIR